MRKRGRSTAFCAAVLVAAMLLTGQQQSVSAEKLSDTQAQDVLESEEQTTEDTFKQTEEQTNEESTQDEKETALDNSEDTDKEEENTQSEESDGISTYHTGDGTGASYGAYPEHILDTGVSPSGTTINLFDYWVHGNSETDRFAPDNSSGTSGFNEHNQPLKFCYGNQYSGAWNTATSSSYVTEGIVSNTLFYNTGVPSLGPIFEDDPNSFVLVGFPMEAQFNPTMEMAGKKAFADVKNLLQLDDEGYYYYDSKLNFAEFDENTKSFNLYDAPGVVNPNPNFGGQFFPFNQAGEIFKEENGKLVNSDIFGSLSQNPQVHPIIHHYMGLTMATSFAQLDGGMKNGKEVIYSFSGDDDVWVFIDGVLVGDVGGMHAPVNLEINFHTGNVHVWGDQIGDRPEVTNKTTTIKECFEEAGRYNESQFNGNTFADGTTHTLKFFFLERGNDVSNLRLKYNLVETPGNTIQKVDQDGNPLSGVEMGLYKADDSYQYTEDDLVFKGTTDEDGMLEITKDRSEAYTTAELKEISDYYVLKEISVPDGYRSVGETHLTFGGDKDSPYLIVDNQWETGTISETKMHTELSISDRVVTDLNNGYSIAGFVTRKKDGKTEILYPDESGKWLSAGSNGYQEAYEHYQNIYHMNGEGLYEADIPMPHDYAENPQNYDIVCRLVKGNTFKAVSLGTPDTLFISNLVVTNQVNQLKVEKTDKDGALLPDSVFHLYTADAVEETNGVFTVKERAVPYDTLTMAEGTGSFGLNGTSDSRKPLISGQSYYLQESKAPEGYNLNPTVVEIIVNDSGVYANAGSDSDDIGVKTGLGGLIQSMKPYAMDNVADVSLLDITAQLQTAETSNGSWSNTGETVHCTYTENGYEVQESGEIPFEQSTGWNRPNIRQCQSHKSTTLDGVKQDLSDKDLLALFSWETTVRVTDRRPASLTIEKEVEGEDKTGSYEFTLNFPGLPADTVFEGVTGTGGKTSVTNGGTFTLSHGEKIILEVPADTKFTIQEEQTGEYTTEILLKEGSGEFVENGVDGTPGLAEHDGIPEGSSCHYKYINALYVEADFKFTKTGYKNIPLSGAGFVLYEQIGTKDMDKELIQVDKDGNILNTYPNKDQWKLHAKTQSGSDGLTAFTGLKSTSVYRLIEYKAPGDYVTPEGQWILKYDSEKQRFEITGSVENPPAFENTEGTIPYRVKNYKMTGLPLTGGRGILLFTAAGILVMLTGGGLKLRKKRNKSFRK